MKVRTVRTVALGIALACGVALAADGKLSKEEWRKVEADAESALAGKEVELLRDALERAAKDQSVRALKLIEKVAQAAESDAVLPACSKAARALEDPKARKELRKDAQAAKHPRVRCALVAALRGSDKEDVPVLVKLIQDASEDVAIPAVRELAEAKVEAAVDPMIALMEKLDGVRNPVWEELRYALGDLLGKRLGSGAEYRSRWAELKAKGGLKGVTPADEKKEKGEEPAKPEEPGAGAPTPGKGGHRTVELFGREVLCTRVVFILDVSGSMTQVDDPSLELPPETQGKDKKPAVDPRSRIERAKRELKKVVKGLPKGTKANFITYSTAPRIWRGGSPPVLHLLDDAAREDAVKFVDAITAEGTTATDEALTRAFEVEGARCFYLLSDGIPTKDGVNRIPTETILGLIRDRNAQRKVRIHTLGFKGADPEFMKAIASETGGEYSDIK